MNIRKFFVGTAAVALLASGLFCPWRVTKKDSSGHLTESKIVWALLFDPPAAGHFGRSESRIASDVLTLEWLLIAGAAVSAWFLFPARPKVETKPKEPRLARPVLKGFSKWVAGALLSAVALACAFYAGSEWNRLLPRKSEPTKSYLPPPPAGFVLDPTAAIDFRPDAPTGKPWLKHATNSPPRELTDAEVGLYPPPKKDIFDELASAPAPMRGLRKVRVTVAAPDVGELLLSQIQTDVEIKLRKAGLAIDENAAAHYCVLVLLSDINPTNQRILGKYGMARVTLDDMVSLKRPPLVELPAPIWQSLIALFHGPPDTIAVQARQQAADLTDEFVNEFRKQNP